MKCPQCQRDHRVKLGMVCNKCEYSFCFNPKERNSWGVTDGRFVNWIKKASRNNTFYFTSNQLYASYVAWAKTPFVGVLLFGFFLGVFGVFVLLNSLEFGLIILFLALCLLIGAFFTKPSAHNRTKFQKLVERWIAEKGSIHKLLLKPSLHQAPPPSPESDIYDYGVERVLVVEHDLLVDLLVLNNQHADQHMVVISESAYPEYMIRRTIELLIENPQMPVFLLHDADANGANMKQRIEKLDWLPLDDRPVIDLGFFPEDFEKLQQTKNYRAVAGTSELPVDALLMGSLALGLSACFASQTTIAEELLRESKLSIEAGSSFG